MSPFPRIGGARLTHPAHGVNPAKPGARAPICENLAMAVRDDCRHYSSRSIEGGDLVQRCRLEANEDAPFACPEGCLFFEPRPLADNDWTR